VSAQTFTRPTRPGARIVSYSELNSFRDCPLKWKLTYEQRWTKEPGPDSKLGIGRLWHECMEAHYLAILDAQNEFQREFPKSYEPILLRRCMAAVVEHLHDSATGAQSEVQALVQWMYEGYVNLYGADLQWEIVAVEQNYYVPLPGLGATRRPSNLYYLRMTTDLIVRERSNGKIWIVDHKSGARLPSKRELDIDDQFGLYTWGARQVGHQVFGALHSAARTQRNVGDANGTKPMLLTERFGRTTMFRTDVALDNLATDSARAAQAAWASKGKPTFSSPDPMKCGWKCEFLEAHLAMRRGIKPSVALKDFGFNQAEYNHTERPDRESSL
jgi:hypothetical protein